MVSTGVDAFTKLNTSTVEADLTALFNSSRTRLRGSCRALPRWALWMRGPALNAAMALCRRRGQVLEAFWRRAWRAAARQSTVKPVDGVI